MYQTPSLIRQEQVQQSFAGMPFALLITLVNAGLLYYLLEPVTTGNTARYWFMALVLITIARLVLYLSFRSSRFSTDSDSTQRWSNLFTFGSLATGCAWGSAALVLFPAESIAHQVFIAFVIAGMTAGAVTTLSSYWPNTVVFIVPALGPLIYQYLHLHNPLADAMGIMVTLYLLILLSSTRNFYLNNLQNITLRREAVRHEQALAHFKSTLDQTLDCVFMFYPDSLQFFYVNQGAIDQIGYRRDELLQMHAYDIKPEYSEAEFRQLLEPLINDELSSTTFETQHRHKSGRHIPVEIFLQYIHPQNEPPRYVAIVRDITERRRLDKIKDEFVSTVSHELRTPLTSIRGSLGLILGGAVGNVEGKQQELLTIAQHNSDRLLLLINDILDINKIESGMLGFQFLDTDLAALVLRSIEDNAAYADSYDVHYHFHAPQGDYWAKLDPARIAQVMSNLLSNAAKFSPAGADIDIELTGVDEYLRVTVFDHGTGISPEFEARVFDKFTQADATDQRQYGGSGLGLAISKSIVEKHRGRIGFDSTPGQGSAFYFELPRDADKPCHK